MNKKKNAGISIVEMLVAIGILGIVMAGLAAMYSSQIKAVNALEFKDKKEQLRISLLGQFLNDSSNCKCLFNGANAFSTAGIARLGGVNPTSIGKFDFVTPGDCATATVPIEFVNDTGVDNLRSTDIAMMNIVPVSGAYQGNLVIDLESTKSVFGLQTERLTIPVYIATASAGAGLVDFIGCSIINPEEGGKSCAGGMGDDGNSRPTFACATQQKYKACMCSADWPNCNCTDGNFPNVGTMSKCFVVGALGSFLNRPSVACTNGSDLVTCMCSGDWGANPCDCEIDNNIFAGATSVTCAWAGGTGSSLSRQSVICASGTTTRACLCSADWDPKCACVTTPFGTAATLSPSCAGADGQGPNLGRTALTCSNGSSMVQCQCSADWVPVCRCTSVAF